jgi:hypothetical protein
MVLAKRITDQLHGLPPGQGGEIQAVAGDFRIEMKYSDWDRLGCLLTRIDVEHSQGYPLAFDSAQIEDKVTYLGERLGIVETERNAGKSIVRSVPPRIDGQVISFYEMVLDGSKGLSLVRYEYDRQRRERTPVPSPLTRDTLERLLVDLIQLAREN